MKISLFLAPLLWFYIARLQDSVEGFAPSERFSNLKRHCTVPRLRYRPEYDTSIPRPSIQTYQNRIVQMQFGTCMNNIRIQEVLTSVFRSSGQVPVTQAFVINILLFYIGRSKLLSALTPSGYFHAMALGTMLWSTLGWKGWLYCVFYLVMGQIVTKIGFADKEKRGIAESRGGRRGPENVWGSAATSLLCAILSSRELRVLNSNKKLFLLGYVAALATKLADTFASEIGKAYGKTTFLITTLERVEPGTEGAISAEGTAAAVFGGFLLSIIGFFLDLISLPAVGISTIAAFIATNAESFIGAAIQGKKGFGFMTNEVVNFVNTLIGGVIAICSGCIMLSKI